jgi:hypothetical protein
MVPSKETVGMKPCHIRDLVPQYTPGTVAMKIDEDELLKELSR